MYERRCSFFSTPPPTEETALLGDGELSETDRNMMIMIVGFGVFLLAWIAIIIGIILALASHFLIKPAES